MNCIDCPGFLHLTSTLNASFKWELDGQQMVCHSFDTTGDFDHDHWSNPKETTIPAHVEDLSLHPQPSTQSSS